MAGKLKIEMLVSMSESMFGDYYKMPENIEANRTYDGWKVAILKFEYRKLNF